MVSNLILSLSVDTYIQEKTFSGRLRPSSSSTHVIDLSSEDDDDDESRKPAAMPSPTRLTMALRGEAGPDVVDGTTAQRMELLQRQKMERETTEYLQKLQKKEDKKLPRFCANCRKRKEKKRQNAKKLNQTRKILIV